MYSAGVKCAHCCRQCHVFRSHLPGLAHTNFVWGRKSSHGIATRTDTSGLLSGRRKAPLIPRRHSCVTWCSKSRGRAIRPRIASIAAVLLGFSRIRRTTPIHSSGRNLSCASGILPRGDSGSTLETHTGADLNFWRFANFTELAGPSLSLKEVRTCSIP